MLTSEKLYGVVCGTQTTASSFYKQQEMKIINYKNTTLEVDFFRTKEVYEITNYTPCDCLGCRNFLFNRENIFPKEFINLLNQIGIDYKKDTNIHHFCKLETGKHFYGGWFNFKGKVFENGIEVHKTETIEVNENFSFFLTKDISMSFFEKEKHSELIQIEIFANSDWVLEKELELD